METKDQVKIKYIVDKIVAIPMFVFLLPLMLLISIFIKAEDQGSIFFKQKRLGINGFIFNIWKFRTMIPNADKLLTKDGYLQQTGLNRVTNIGKVLRTLSLDELPQIINILKGEMSFIGPRPALIEHFERYSLEQKKRLQMRPGITGLAQINGRNILKWSKRIEFDLNYIHQYSLLMDLKIILKTVKVVLSREGVVIDRNPDQVDDLKKDKNSN